jgi:hypothetical protein
MNFSLYRGRKKGGPGWWYFIGVKTLCSSEVIIKNEVKLRANKPG